MPISYPEFKKQLMPILDRQMAEIGFGKGKSKTPSYWKHPHPDQRLAWVVNLDFLRSLNNQFDIHIGPYWMPYRLPSDSPFPLCVGFRGYLTPRGFSESQYLWKATPQVLEVVANALAGPGIEWLSQYDSPEALFALEPRGILAADLGRWNDARRMLLKELQQQFCQQQFYDGQSPSVKLMDDERMERTINYLRDVVQHTGGAQTLDTDINQCEIHARMQELTEKRLESAKNPQSRWHKSRIKFCEARLKELEAS